MDVFNAETVPDPTAFINPDRFQHSRDAEMPPSYETLEQHHSPFQFAVTNAGNQNDSFHILSPLGHVEQLKESSKLASNAVLKDDIQNQRRSEFRCMKTEN